MAQGNKTIIKKIVESSDIKKRFEAIKLLPMSYCFV
jgi:hypothetical protein